MELAKAIALKENLDDLRPLSKEPEVAVIQKLRFEWNYHSNRLEGNSLTYLETKALLFTRHHGAGKATQRPLRNYRT